MEGVEVSDRTRSTLQAECNALDKVLRPRTKGDDEDSVSHHTDHRRGGRVSDEPGCT